MTLRTKDSIQSPNLNQVYSDLLMLQTESTPAVTVLRSTAPLFSLLPPKATKALLEFMLNPERTPDVLEIPGWQAACYSSVEEAQLSWPNLKAQRAYPFAIATFLATTEAFALFDFAPYGAVVLSRSAIGQPAQHGLEMHLLMPLLNYVLCPELWGPQGKWIRFHERLHRLFEKYGLLEGPDQPGRYALKTHAQKLEAHGFQGDLVQKQFHLTMPWTFSLNELKKLEEILEREF